jgi:glycosyltransferase involved in cell wall biosynthesis
MPIKSENQRGGRMFISVIIPLYNKEHSVRKSILSVLRQSYDQFELLVINDGSTDKSLNNIKNINDSRLRIISQNNKGVSAARNRGGVESRSNYIAFLDADDLWDRDYLSSQSKLIERFSSSCVWATGYRIIIKGQVQKEVGLCKTKYKKTRKGMLLDDYFSLAANSAPFVCSSAVVIKKQALLEVGGFPLGIASGEDLLTWAKLACNYKIAYLDQPKVSFIREQKTGRPIRKHTKEDPGYNILVDLAKQNPKLAKGIRKYIVFWCKMRASCFIREGDMGQVRREVKKAFCASNINFKMFLYFVASLMPTRWAKAIFRAWFFMT